MLENFDESVEAPSSDDEMINSAVLQSIIPPPNFERPKVAAVVIAWKPISCAISHLAPESECAHIFNWGTILVLKNTGFLILEKEQDVAPDQFFSDFSLIVVLHAQQGNEDRMSVISSTEVHESDNIQPFTTPFGGVAAMIMTRAMIQKDARCIVLSRLHKSINCDIDVVASLWETITGMISLGKVSDAIGRMESELRVVMPLDRKVPLYT